MNDTYLHITLTHLPIVGCLIALVILFSGWIQKNLSLQKAALWLLIVLAAVTIVVNHTGEEAEEFVEHLPGYSQPKLRDIHFGHKVSNVGVPRHLGEQEMGVSERPETQEAIHNRFRTA